MIWWTRRDSNPHQCSNQGFDPLASSAIGNARQWRPVIGAGTCILNRTRQPTWPAAPGTTQAAGNSTFLAVALPSVPARPLSLLSWRCLAATSSDETFVLYPLSYGPPDMGPAGLEPATTSLRGCSSICIRSATSKTLFQRLPVGDQEKGETLSVDNDVVPPRIRQPAAVDRGLDGRPQATRFTRAAAGCPVRACRPAWPEGAVLLWAFACGAVLTSQW